MKHTNESSRRTAEMRKQYGTAQGQSMASRDKAYGDMDGGAASGKGRIDKIAEYGMRAKNAGPKD
jgi:hypothetical protein